MATPERLPIANRSIKTLRTTSTRGVLFDLLSHSATHGIAKWETDFMGALNTTDLVAAGSGTAAALTSTGESGSIDMVTGAVDNQTSSIYLAGGNFVGNQDPVVSIRLKLSSIAGVNVQFGFCDNIAATVLTTTALGPFVSPLADTPTLVSTTANAVALVMDTSATAFSSANPTYWRLAYSRASTTGLTALSTTAATLVAPTASTYQRLTLALERSPIGTPNMAAKAYINGVLVASVSTGVISNTAALYPFFLVGSAGGNSKTMTVEHFEAYQLRDTSA